MTDSINLLREKIEELKKQPATPTKIEFLGKIQSKMCEP